MAYHKNLSGTDIHVPYAFTYANATARTGATGFVTSDIGKLARQTDNDSLWMLTDDSPVTWVAVGANSGDLWGAISGTITDQTDLMSCLSNYLTTIGGCYLSDLADVSSTAPSSGCALVWDNILMEWVPGAVAASPAGNSANVQFNDSGAFCATDCFCFDASTSCLRLSEPTGNCYNTYIQGGCDCQFYITDSVANLNLGLRFHSATNSVILEDNVGQQFNSNNCNLYLKFHNGFHICDTSCAEWLTFDPCSGKIKFNERSSPGYYTFPACAGTTNQYLALDSNNDLQWTSPSAGSAAGPQYAIQMNDGAGNFCGVDCFTYQYCQNCFDQRGACCVAGDYYVLRSCSDATNWYINSTSTCYATLCTNLVFTIKDCGCNYFCFIEDTSCLGITMYPCTATICFNGSCCCGCVGIVSGACGLAMQKCSQCVIVDYCCTDSFYVGFCTSNDYLCWKDCEIEFAGCCNFVMRWNNGCSNGYNQLNSQGGLGFVINQCCQGGMGNYLPIVLAQENDPKVELGSDCQFRTFTNMDICGGLTVAGTAPAADGTYSNPTSITIQCGIITAIS